MDVIINSAAKAQISSSLFWLRLFSPRTLTAGEYSHSSESFEEGNLETVSQNRRASPHDPTRGLGDNLRLSLGGGRVEDCMCRVKSGGLAHQDATCVSGHACSYCRDVLIWAATKDFECGRLRSHRDRHLAGHAILEGYTLGTRTGPHTPM